MVSFYSLARPFIKVSVLAVIVLAIMMTIGSYAYADDSNKKSGILEKKNKSFFSFLGLDNLLTDKKSKDKKENNLRSLEKPKKFIRFKGPKSGVISANSLAEKDSLLDVSLEEYYLKQFDSKINISADMQAKPSILFSLSPNKITSHNQPLKIGYSPYSKGRRNVSGGSQITFTLDKNGTYLDPKAFKLSLGSSFLINNAPKASNFDYYNSIVRRAYNFSLGLGYEGFVLDASYSQENTLSQTGLKGFDIGFGYYDSDWSTSISFARYNHNYEDQSYSKTFTQQFSDYNDDPLSKIDAFEFKAIIQIYPHVSLSGKYSYYRYDNFFRMHPDDHMFTFGTFFSF